MNTITHVYFERGGKFKPVLSKSDHAPVKIYASSPDIETLRNLFLEQWDTDNVQSLIFITRQQKQSAVGVSPADQTE